MTEKQLPAPLSEPTDPRIAEIAARQQKANTEHLALGAHADNWDEECPACVGQLESETHANRDRSYLLNALSLLQQRLEQQDQQIGELLQSVNARTSERDQAREAIKVQETFYEKRVTAERDDLRRAIHGGDLHRTLSHAILVSTANDQRASEEELNGDGGVRAKLEAAEATIASLRMERDEAREQFDQHVEWASNRFDFSAHLQRQREFSERTFGPGMRTAGVVDHIRKELREIEAEPGDLREWIDVVILGLDGAWRAGFSPEEIIDTLVTKQARNEAREWPDWRKAPLDKAIEHVKADASLPSSAVSQTAERPWKSMETAPDDGSTVVVYDRSYSQPVVLAFWDREVGDEGGQCWRAADATWDRLNPTAWTEHVLPDAPSAETQEGGQR